MKALTIVGSGKFALEMARLATDASAGELQVVRYLSIEGETSVTPPEHTRPYALAELTHEAALLLGVSDAAARAALLASWDAPTQARFVSLVHPAATLFGALAGHGIVIGPHCHIGVNAVVGSFCVLNYLVSIGHHSRIGSGNFFSPGTHCANSVTVGDRNLFGLGCLIGPGVQIGDDNHFQVGSAVLENVGHGLVGISNQRLRFIPRQTGSGR